MSLRSERVKRAKQRHAAAPAGAEAVPARLGDVVSSQRSPRWAFMQRFDIPDGYEPEKTYLSRLRIIQTPWFGIYLHRIFLPDRDRDPHDHPWPFVSFVLRGGYTERIYRSAARTVLADTSTVLVNHRRWSLHRIRLDIAHQIEVIEPGLTTLVLVGPRRRQWGFWTARGFVPWTAYEKAGLGPDPFDS